MRPIALTRTVLSLFAGLLCAVAVHAAEHPKLQSERLNQLQIIGSHNSYKMLPEPALFELMQKAGDHATGVDYHHLTLADQLNLGLRNLEIDVYHDPKGGLYASPLGNKLLKDSGVEPTPLTNADELMTPGFKVLHQADFDFRSSVYSFERALAMLAEWSDEHPGHIPVIVTMNCKRNKDKLKDSPVSGQEITPGNFNTRVLDQLDSVIKAGLGARLLTPDGVRGDAPTLPQALAARGWPALSECRGTFLFVLDEGAQLRDQYVENHPALAGRVMFTLSAETSPEAAFFIINDPLKEPDRIARLVKAGFMIRTRADAETREARTGNFTRFNAAKASGAQVITTDYYIADLRRTHSYIVRFSDRDTSLSPFLRLNPLSPPSLATPPTVP